MLFAEILKGLAGSDLGGGLHKKRIPLPGRGKRGGARTLIAYNQGDVLFFIYGFPKNERDNVHSKELQALKFMASKLLGYTTEQISTLIVEKELVEIKNE
jgi:hypothetical protein